MPIDIIMSNGDSNHSSRSNSFGNSNSLLNGKLNGHSNGVTNGTTELKVTTNQANFVYEDPDHYSFLLDKLNTLRKSKQFCDVILQVIRRVTS